jgi:hypothetical protein
VVSFPQVSPLKPCMHLVIFRYMIHFLRWGVVSTSPNPQAGGTVRDCLFKIFAATLHICRPFLHPQPEDAPCHGDRDPLIMVPCHGDRDPLIMVPCHGDRDPLIMVPCHGDRDPLQIYYTQLFIVPLTLYCRLWEWCRRRPKHVAVDSKERIQLQVHLLVCVAWMKFY